MDFIVVRVYGLLIFEEKLLVSDEIWAEKQFTKFPGGGLEPGEGTLDCLKREFLEELNLEIAVKNHFYTTDFYLPSAFDSNKQILSIYYCVEAQKPSALTRLSIKTKRFDFENFQNGAQCLRWQSIKDINPKRDFTFPIDQLVAEKLLAL